MLSSTAMSSAAARPVRFHVELIDGPGAQGWALDSRHPGQEVLSLRLDGQPLQAQWRRTWRHDVCESTGVQGVALGWVCDLPPEIWARWFATRGELEFWVNGLRHPGLAWVLDPTSLHRWLARRLLEADARTRADWQARFQAHRAAISKCGLTWRSPAASFPPIGQHEGLRGLCLVGWLADVPTARHVLGLQCQGKPLPCPVRRLSRQDVCRALDWPEEGIGFELELPGVLWLGVAPENPLVCQLTVDGKPWGEPVALDRLDLVAGFDAAAGLADAGERTRQGLLALEHILHAGLWHTLGGGRQRRAGQLAALAGVSSWLAQMTGDAKSPPLSILPEQAPQGWLGRWVQRRWRAWLALVWLQWLQRSSRRTALALRTEIALTQALGLFDAALYDLQVPESLRPGLSALAHYVIQGDARSLVPHALLDPRHYTGQLPGRRHPGINRLLHYGLKGRFEALSTSAWFDGGAYLRRYRDVRRSGRDPLRHFVHRGWRAGRLPRDGFVANSLQGQPLAQRLAREVNPLRAHPVLRYLLDGLPADAPLPEQGRLPWMVPTTLDGWDHLDLAPWQALPVPDPRRAITLDVVIPIYAGAQESLRCLWSVLSAPGRTDVAVVVVDDASPEPALSAILAQLAGLGLIELLVNEQNLGFVRSVNKGMALHPGRDVLLLNADARVHGDWLDRLRRHAEQDPRIASVTPLSNNATIFSYPRTQFNNQDGVALQGDALDALAARCNAGRRVEVPTAMGFCMYLRRACLDQIGLFDAGRYGRGYGEENDWCRRAVAAGWIHVAATDVYVLHQGSVSFKAEADSRSRAALTLLLERFPDYQQQIDAWIEGDPLQAARVTLDLARLRADLGEAGLVLMVSHDRGGGTARHEEDVAAGLRARGLQVLWLRPSVAPGCVTLRAPELGDYPNLEVLPLVRGGDDAPDLAQAMAALPLQGVQVHHLADLPAALAEVLPGLCAARGVPLEVTVHDYHLICPRINLVGSDGRYCAEPDEAGCDRCLAADGLLATSGPIQAWRQRHARLLRAARQVVAPDLDVVQRLERHLPGLRVEAVPHEQDFQPSLVAAPSGPVRHVLVIGALSQIKGLEVLRQLARAARLQGRDMRFTLLGHSSDDAALRAEGVRVLGRYDDAELQGLIAAEAPDLILIPSIWPETYCYVLSAALRAGRPVSVFDLGAQARRLRALGLTRWIVPLSEADLPERLLARLAGEVAPAPPPPHS
ncbi:glycosyltransferase [Ideonella oryzae]|uniref:Glycosyltransferase n=1 Tax=Ideonella oryzae TaxID=2937441 RepID=A0ABT1BRT5_9BURK|nr:glycosyltransferase [Ideonella oryzae]MCO5978939.1 glycosyltransferase [Ideonella oryzae]